MLRAVKGVLLAGGLALAAYLVYAQGGLLLASLRPVGRGFLLYLAASLLWFAVFPGGILSAMIVTAILDLRRRRKAKRREGPGPHSAADLEGPRPGKVMQMWARIADFFWANPRQAGLSCLWFFVG